MKILLTSGRMPWTVDQIRKLAQAGHEVYVAETFKGAPGAHSRHVVDRMTVASPKNETTTFIAQILEYVQRFDIELVLPQSEEVFYLAKHRDYFAEKTDPFFSSLETLATVHNKASLSALAQDLGLPVAPTTIVTNMDEFDRAVLRHPEYVARAAFSRSGLSIVANVGPLAEKRTGHVQPTPENPWLVQDYVDGLDLCTYSIAHNGRIATHLTYRHPITWKQGGVKFESIVEERTLEAAAAIIRSVGFHGQISFDFRQTADGTCYVIECNARPTNGATLLSSAEFVDGLFNSDPSVPFVLSAGRRTQMDLAVIHTMVSSLRGTPSQLRSLLDTRDIWTSPDDPAPGVFLVASNVGQAIAAKGRLPTSISDFVSAQFSDLEWNGEPIP